ncbi:hypothetical protein RB195_022429 [Necator americanus]|uniref:Uncharacterized protein n=1 Tax=Necator americanus TaxID=51031 RepID=A0ABR1EF86_NECAM
MGIVQWRDSCGDRPHTSQNWCRLDVSVVPFFCSGSDHRLLRAKIRLSHTMERNICYRQRRRKEVHNDSVLEDSLFQNDWEIEDKVKRQTWTTSCRLEEYELVLKVPRSRARRTWIELRKPPRNCWKEGH